MLVTRAGLSEGEWVFVWGIGSGVATASLQVAKALGARVIVTSSSDEKLERALELGADAAVNHAEGDVAGTVREVDGRARRGRRRRARRRGDVEDVAPGGGGGRAYRRLRCHERPQPTREPASHLVEAAHGRRLDDGDTGGLQAVYELVASGRAKPVVDRVFPLEEAAAAHEHLEAGRQLGKVVLENRRVSASRGRIRRAISCGHPDATSLRASPRSTAPS